MNWYKNVITIWKMGHYRSRPVIYCSTMTSHASFASPSPHLLTSRSFSSGMDDMPFSITPSLNLRMNTFKYPLVYSFKCYLNTHFYCLHPNLNITKSIITQSFPLSPLFFSFNFLVTRRESVSGPEELLTETVLQLFFRFFYPFLPNILLLGRVKQTFLVFTQSY